MPGSERRVAVHPAVEAGALVVLLVASGLLAAGIGSASGTVHLPEIAVASSGALDRSPLVLPPGPGPAGLPVPAATSTTPANASPAAETGTVIATVTTAPGPYGVGYDPLNGFLYVANRGNNTVSVLNGTELVATLRVGAEPMGVVFDPVNGFIYVSNYGSNNLTLISGETVVGWVDDPSFAGPCFPAYDPRDRSIYVPNVGGYGVSVVNGTTVTTYLPTGTYPFAAAYDPRSGYVYVSNNGAASRGGSTVTVLDNVTVVATLSGNFTNPSGIAVDLSTGDVYVANKNITTPGGGFVTVLRGLAVVARIPVGPELWGATYDPANHLVYVSGNDVDEASASLHANTIAAINGTSVVRYLPGQYQPYGSAYDPDHALLYVANGGADNVSIVSTALAIGPMTSTWGGPVDSRDLGEAVYFGSTLWANGSGSGTERISWSPSGLLSCLVGGPSRTGPLIPGAISFLCSAAAVGSGAVWINLTDTAGGSVWSRLPFQVFPWPLAGAPVPSASTLDVGQVATFTESVVVAGSGGDTFTWNSTAELSCPPSSTVVLRCLANSTGSNASVRVVVTDSNGGSSSASSARVSVNADPEVAAPTFSPTAIRIGDPVTISIVVTGGSGGERVTWYGLPPGCSAVTSSLTCRPEQSGAYRISASVNDSVGFVASSAASILNVSPAAGSPTILGLPPTAFYAVIVAVVVVAFTGAIGIRMRRRHAVSAPSPPPGRAGGATPPAAPPSAP